MIVYGLMVNYREYQCTVCDHVQYVQTNHTDTCFAYCKNCSWRSNFDPNNPERNVSAGENRPFKYVGGVLSVEDYNKCHWTDDRIAESIQLQMNESE